MKQNASEIRSLLSLQRRLEHSLNKDEAKIVNNLGPTRAFETGALTYGLAHALGSTTPLNWGLTAAGLKIGGRVLSKIGRKNYLSPRFKYNVGSGLSGHVPVMMGGNLARPVGAALDMYKTAREASPPEQEPVQGPSPSEVDDFSGFGSSQEWINKQLGN